MKGFLGKLYSLFWVPFFGRILSLFIGSIEGKKPLRKPTFDIDKSTEKCDG